MTGHHPWPPPLKVGPDEAIERLNKALGAVVRRHGESPEVRELCHAAAVVRLMLGGRAGGTPATQAPPRLPGRCHP